MELQDSDSDSLAMGATGGVARAVIGVVCFLSYLIHFALCSVLCSGVPVVVCGDKGGLRFCKVLGSRLL
jgi:hypothetical protein